MAFRGWPAEALEFFEGLEADNSKAYWTANRSVYEQQVRGPMLELLAELGPAFGEGKLFRPNRDVRFSADKAPYKTAIAATLGDGYVQLSAGGLAAGRGMYVMVPDQLERYRRAVANDRTGEQLGMIVSSLERQKVSFTAHDTLKTVPRGYGADHARVALLRHKGLIAWKEWTVAAWLGTLAAKKRIVDFLLAAEPLSEWLAANVGPSTVEAPAGRARRS